MQVYKSSIEKAPPRAGSAEARQVLTLLALLVQKYKPTDTCGALTLLALLAQKYKPTDICGAAGGRSETSSRQLRVK